MNRQRDIERTLDAWFVDGPTMVPDRLFDAVLDQVERVPQRRLARLSLRYAEMNPRIRLFTVLAAALLVVVAAIAIIGGGSQGLVKSPTSPPPSPSPAALPPELTERFEGPVRAVAGVAAGDVARLRFTQKSFSYDNGQRPQLQSTAGLDGEDLVLVATSGTDGCRQGDEGRYPFTTSTGGATLTIATGTDECAARQAIVAGTWQRAGCRNLQAWCLGAVDAGTYRSQYFDPRAATTDAAKADFGGLTWTTTTGDWANQEDGPSMYTIMRASDYTTGGVNEGANPPDAITVLARASAAVLHADCAQEPEPGIGRDRAALSAWLIAHPGLDVTRQSAITIDGLQATVLDLVVAPSWTETCPDEPPFVAAPLFVGDYHWAMEQNDPMRVILFDLPGGGTVLVTIDPEDPSKFDQLLAETMPIVESLDFK